MAYQFPPAVEQWRSTVQRYVRPEYVNKVLWVIEKESSGNPAATNGPHATGLLQIESLPGRPSQEALKDPDTNIRWAVENLGINEGNFRDWGENNTFNGRPFGAFGYNKYPGDDAFGPGGGGPVNGRASASMNMGYRPSWSTATITQGYGPTDEVRDSGYEGHAHFNKGYDYGLVEGTPIDGNVAGVVERAGDQGDGWGISVKVRDAEGNLHNYGHLSGVNVREGQTVGAGQVLGYSGNTGASSGPHLSYDVLDSNGRYVDPGRWLNGSGGGTSMAMPPLPELPFTHQEYGERYAEMQGLIPELFDAFGEDGTYLKPGVDPNDPRVQRVWQLQSEIQQYEDARDTWAQDWDLYLKGQSYTNENDPRRIDAENSANEWARQFQINEAAGRDFANAVTEQRSTQNDASSESKDFFGSSHFSGALGTRMPSTNLPSNDELYKKSVDRIAANLPKVQPIPYPTLPSLPSAPKVGNSAGGPGLGKLPPNFGGPGYEVEGDTLPPGSTDIPIGRRTTPSSYGQPTYGDPPERKYPDEVVPAWETETGGLALDQWSKNWNPPPKKKGAGGLVGSIFNRGLEKVNGIRP